MDCMRQQIERIEQRDSSCIERQDSMGTERKDQSTSWQLAVENKQVGLEAEWALKEQERQLVVYRSRPLWPCCNSTCGL